jgi:diguanylate cyclase (GGDEF)-like protein
MSAEKTNPEQEPLSPQEAGKEYARAVLDDPGFTIPVAESIKDSPEAIRAFTETLVTEKREADKRAAEFEERATHDQVTGLPNRWAFTEQLMELEPLLHRFGGHILWMDMAGLGRLNNEYSHTLGDEALKKASDAMQKAFRSYEIPARFADDNYKLPSRTGGDEFGAILVDADPQKVIDRLERELARPEHYVLGKPIELYYGVAEVGTEEPVEETLERAQEAQAADKLRKKAVRKS